MTPTTSRPEVDNQTRISEVCPGRSSMTGPRPWCKRHVAPGVAVPLHPEAAAFADHYGFAIDVLAAYRPTGKGRVERQVAIVRDHVLAGRTFDSLAELDARVRRVGADPPRPGAPHPRRGRSGSARSATGPRCGRCRSCRIWSATGTCAGSARTAWSASRPAATPVPAADGRSRAGQRVEVRAGVDTVAIHALAGRRPVAGAGQPSARRAAPGSWVVDPAHWDGLPDGHTRAVTVEPADPAGRHRRPDAAATGCCATRPL